MRPRYVAAVLADPVLAELPGVVALCRLGLGLGLGLGVRVRG